MKNEITVKNRTRRPPISKPTATEATKKKDGLSKINQATVVLSEKNGSPLAVGAVKNEITVKNRIRRPPIAKPTASEAAKKNDGPSKINQATVVLSEESGNHLARKEVQNETTVNMNRNRPLIEKPPAVTALDNKDVTSMSKQVTVTVEINIDQHPPIAAEKNCI